MCFNTPKAGPLSYVTSAIQKEKIKTVILSILNALGFSVIVCDGHVLKYGLVGLLDNQSILMRVKLFFHIHFMYLTHQSFTQYSLQLSWIVANILKEDNNRTLTELVSVLRHQTITILICFEIFSVYLYRNINASVFYYSVSVIVKHNKRLNQQRGFL